jgi:hypothetical protein
LATSLTPNSLKDRARSFSSLSDAVVQAALDEAERWVNEEAWGSKYDDGVFYFACHILEEDSALNAVDAGDGVSVLPAGPVTREKILNWEAEYATAKDFVEDDLATTSWGRRFISRRRLVFAARGM